MGQEILDVEIGGCCIKMAVDAAVFRPTLTTRLLAEQVKIPKDSVVLDLGCGVGPLGIMAALKGAKLVYAVDVVEPACELAKHNAELNGVADRMRILPGDMFEPVKDMRFDVIIDDVSGIAEKVARISPWYPPLVPTGGEDGTEPTIRMLQESVRHLTDRGVLYFPVASLASVPLIIREAERIYGSALEKIFEKPIPFCRELNEAIRDLEPLKAKRIIDFQPKRTRHLWTLTIFRATHPGHTSASS